MNPLRTKIDFFMPLEIGRYLQDTAHLSTCQSGAYLHLLMYYWAHGPLPNDMEQLANIARMAPDAWSIAYASLKHFFSTGPDGLLHQAGADRRLAFWKGKKQKAHEKASKAARARWDKHKAKQGLKTDAPSNAHALLEQCPISVKEVQDQKQNLPPTPTAARRGIEAASAALPETPPKSAGDPGGLAAIAPAAPAARPVGGAAAGPATAKSEHTGKPAKTAATGASGSANGATRHGSSTASVAGQRTGRNGHENLGVRPSKSVSREIEFEREVLEYWKGQNPKHPKLKFQPADHRALATLLKRDPEMDLAMFRELLKNRAQSDVNPAAMPHKWLRNLMEYAAGPLGKYGKAAARPRQY